MDKNILKRFATESRQDLIEKISNKIKTFYVDENFDSEQKGEVYILSNEKHTLSLSKEEYEKRRLLIKRIKELGVEQVIEEAAYTWFNRIVAIRYMEINDYLPLTKDNYSLGIRVLSSKDNTPDPEIMKFTNLTNPELDIDFNKEKYIELKDDNEKYKYVLLLICEKLGRVIPQVFDGITDYINILYEMDLQSLTKVEDIDEELNKIAKEIKEDSTTDAILKEKHKNTTESRKENEAGNTNLINFLTFEEGHTPLSADGKYYLISDSLDGVATAGSGVTLKNCASYFAKYGIDVNDYKAGDYIPVDIVDKVKCDLVADKRNYVINLAQENNITLTDNQIDALTSRAYQFGNIEKFPVAYKEAGGDIDTFVQNYMMSGGYSNRRERESNLFKNGYNI